MYSKGDIITGDYAVDRVFTNGGMGVVYKVHHLRWNIDLALKCPRAELFQSGSSKKGFIKECETWMDIGVHPNIVTCFYIRHIDSVPSILMEYLDSGSLADYINSGYLYNADPLTVLSRILDIAIQTARGLGYAHDKGYVHQDVKPANVLMASSGTVKISDFGLSKAKGVLESSRISAKEGCSIIVSSGGCTPAYASPEQMLDRQLSRRTDIWSWALMILEMMHGGIFWKVGPLAAREFRKLWGWQIFSKRVQKSSELLRLIKECLDENENNRPHDFSVIESRLVGIFERTFACKYVRTIPPKIFLSEASLCNRIASYSELGKDGGDYFGKVFDAHRQLKQLSPWSIWGDINYAVYRHACGGRVSEILNLLENQLQYAIKEEEKIWCVDLLLGFGVTSAQHKLYKKLDLSGCPVLMKKIRTRHDYMRTRLMKVLEAAPEQFKQESDGDSFCEHFCYKHCNGGFIIAQGVSENRTCSVDVFVPTDQAGNADILNIEVNVALAGMMYKCKDDIPKNAKIKFLTTDDLGKKISLWVYYNNRYFQKVLRVDDGNLIPYKIDYRHDEGWGMPKMIVASGDSRRLMLLNGAHCRVWYSDVPTAGDGRNICDFSLADYGLIPPDRLLPNLQLEQGFEYCIDEKTAYSLMAVLSETYSSHGPQSIIRIPDNCEHDIERSVQGVKLIDEAMQAMHDGNERKSAKAISASIRIGILPDDQLLEMRHQIVKKCANNCIVKAWHQSLDNQYWEGEGLRLFGGSSSTPDVVTYGKTMALVDEKGESKLVELVSCKTFANNDILGLCYNVNSDSTDSIDFTDVLEVCRYTTNSQCVRKRWGFRFPKRQSVTTTIRNMDIGCETVSLLIGNAVYIIDLGSGAVLKILEGVTSIDYQKISFDNSAPMRFFMVSHGQALALNKDFDSIDDIWDCQIGFSETRKLCDIASNGQRYLFDIGWGFLVCDFGERKSWSVPYLSNAVNKSLSPSFLLRAIFSPCGRAVAVMYGDGRLMLLDSKHGNVVFDHKVAMETFKDIVFDKTGRWLFVLHDHQKLETFQLLWDFSNDGIGCL